MGKRRPGSGCTQQPRCRRPPDSRVCTHSPSAPTQGTAGAHPCHTESRLPLVHRSPAAPSGAVGAPPLLGYNPNLPWEPLAPLTPLSPSSRPSPLRSHLKAGDQATMVAQQQTRGAPANQPVLHHDPGLSLPARTHAQPSEPPPAPPMPHAPRLANQRATSGLNFCSSHHVSCHHEATGRDSKAAGRGAEHPGAEPHSSAVSYPPALLRNAPWLRHQEIYLMPCGASSLLLAEGVKK